MYTLLYCCCHSQTMTTVKSKAKLNQIKEKESREYLRKRETETRNKREKLPRTK